MIDNWQSEPHQQRQNFAERGWKDTVYLNPREPVRIAMKFLHPGIFMYHCHILEHEDNGMMGQFLVV